MKIPRGRGNLRQSWLPGDQREAALVQHVDAKGDKKVLEDLRLAERGSLEYSLGYTQGYERRQRNT